MKSVNTQAYARVNADFDVKGTVVNKGAAALTSFDVTYNINGGENVATYTVSNINLAYGQTYMFTHNIPASVATNSLSQIQVIVSNPNGVIDSIADNSGSKSIIIYDNSTQRTVLFEQFTTAKCPNCPPAHTYLDGIIEPREENIVWMAHHAGYYTDNLTIPENEAMLVFYNSNGTLVKSYSARTGYNSFENLPAGIYSGNFFFSA